MRRRQDERERERDKESLREGDKGVGFVEVSSFRISSFPATEGSHVCRTRIDLALCLVISWNQFNMCRVYMEHPQFFSDRMPHVLHDRHPSPDDSS